MKNCIRYAIWLVVFGGFGSAAFANETADKSVSATQVDSQTSDSKSIINSDNTQTVSGETNESVARQWSQTNGGTAVPSITQQQDGGTKIEWHGGISFDDYNNSVKSNNSFGSSLSQGNHSVAQLQSDLRATNQAGDVNYLQLGASMTGDRSVLSQYPRQINSVQFGRAGTGYIVSVGDVTPYFSSLGSALGVRGLLGQRQIGQVSVSGYAGVVAPSWEYLESRIPRTQMMREVQGAKLEYSFSDKLKAYVTGQHGMDKADSVDTNFGFSQMPAQIGSGSIGFQWFDSNYQVAGETALSHFSQDGEQSRNGRASILDGAWRGQTVSLRGGYHDLSSKYISLSQAAQPGTREAYTGGDWVIASWVSLGVDVRNSKNFTLATFFSPSQMTDTDSGSIRGNINFGADHPNWSLSLQESVSNSRDPQGLQSYNEQGSIYLNYAQYKWNASIAYGMGLQQSEANPTYDSHTDNWQASVGRLFNNQDELSAATWTVNSNLSASLQDQHLASGLETKAFLSSLNVSCQRESWGMLNLMLGNGFNTRPLGQSALRMTTIQIDASHQFGIHGSVKLYARQVKRNMNDDALFADERVTGVQLSYVF